MGFGWVDGKSGMWDICNKVSGATAAPAGEGNGESNKVLMVKRAVQRIKTRTMMQVGVTADRCVQSNKR